MYALLIKFTVCSSVVPSLRTSSDEPRTTELRILRHFLADERVERRCSAQLSHSPISIHALDIVILNLFSAGNGCYPIPVHYWVGINTSLGLFLSYLMFLK